MSKKISRPQLVSSVLLSVFIFAVSVFGQSSDLQGDLGKSFSKFNLIRLNSQAALQKALSGKSLTLPVSGRNLELNLTPNDLRGENYRAEDTSADGILAFKKGAVTTFKGKVAGDAGSEVRMTIDGAKTEGFFVAGGEKFYVESARNYSNLAEAEDLIVYQEKDLLKNVDFVCHSELGEKIQRGKEMVTAQSIDSAQTVRVIKLATDADFLFVTQYGGANQANSEILSILNMVDGVYQRELNLSIKVVFQHTWSTPDPFTPVSTNTILTSFQSYWEGNFPQTQYPRDATHLFSAKPNIAGTGLSYIGVICNDPADAYGLSGWINSFPANVLITGHEIGHNLGAHHVDATQNCAGTIMNALLSDTTPLTFCAASRSEIGNFEAANGSCLAQKQNLSTRFDFDADGKADISVFRPSNGIWCVINSANNSFNFVQFGAPGDKIVPADYDGDGKVDMAVYRGGAWYRMRSSSNTFDAVNFGAATDVPVPADYDGDGKADVAVFRPADGVWHRLLSGSNNAYSPTQFGASGDIPLPEDFDGDGKADINVFRPSTGTWYRINSGNGAFVGNQFGQAGDKPVMGDFDGDGKADIAVFRPAGGYWFYMNSSTGNFNGVAFGLPTDIPVAADYDGDSKTDIAVYRNGYWFRINSSDNSFSAISFGAATDIPVPSYYNQ